MNTTHSHTRRIDKLVRHLQPTCRTCYGHASAVVFVPDGVDETDPEWNPVSCPECDIPLRSVRRILGISREEMYGIDDLDAQPRGRT